MATERRKLLMQNAKDPARWEALQIIGEGPQDFVRTELDTKGAEAYQRGGGFSIVPSREYNDELGRISERVRGARASAPTPASEPAWEMPRNAAESVALLNQQGGYEGRGAAAATGMADDEAALSGRSMVEKPMPMDPELERRIARERARDAAGGEQSRRVAAERVRDAAGGRPATRPVVPGTSGNRPTIVVGKPGEAGTLRAPTALRPPSDLPPTSSEVEGVATRAAPAGDEEFASAQQEGDERALAVALSRAGARASEAISGVRGDGDVYDALEKTTGNPVRDLLARREADKRKALEDPTSEQSKRLQAYVSKALPGVYSPEELQSITAADADTVTRYGEMRQRLDQRAADRAVQAEQRAADIAREDAVREDTQAFQAAENAKDRAARRARGGGTRTAAAQASLERDVQKAGEDLEGAGTLSGDLQYLDQQAAKDDIPGVGRWDSKKTGLLSVFASDDDTRTMQTMRSVVGRLLKERSGTAASDAEVERVMGELGMGPGSTEQEFRVGLQRLRQDVGSALRTKQARYRPEVIQTYQQRGGKTAQDIASAPQAQPEMVRMLDPQGQERLVPRARVQDAIAAGGRLVNG